MFPFPAIFVADMIAVEIQFAENDQHDALVVELPRDVVRQNTTKCCCIRFCCVIDLQIRIINGPFKFSNILTVNDDIVSL